MVTDHPSPVGKSHATPLSGDLEQTGVGLANAFESRERVGVHGLGQSRALDLAELVVRRPVVIIPTFQPDARSWDRPFITSGRQ
ncbi:hypothetical protein ABT061_39160 [Streptosporangium sp. NPDC002544]|uniref:hypothetical protein n=1 Tax=Streptosporangium sp. NPDC002544 TaxID=3154538 RepID=UPI003326DEB1